MNLIQTDPVRSLFEGDIAGIDYRAVINTGDLVSDGCGELSVSHVAVYKETKRRL